MPYTIRKQKCKQSDGDAGTYVMSYTDKKGKKRRNCHTSKKKAQGQIAAIEGPALKSGEEKEGDGLHEKSLRLSEAQLRKIVRLLLSQ